MQIIKSHEGTPPHEQGTSDLQLENLRKRVKEV